MEDKIEFSNHAYCKMNLHAMKYPHFSCSGFLLSPIDGLATKNEEIASNGKTKETTASQDSQSESDSEVNESDHVKLQIVDAIPVSHISQYNSSSFEIAFNCIQKFAAEQGLVISGFYQSDRFEDNINIDIFSQRVADKIYESFKSAVLCTISFDKSDPSTLICYQMIDSKWRRKPQQAIELENDPTMISKNVLFTKEKLYRQLADFDDHFIDINLDWTNSKINQRIDNLVAEGC